MVAVKSKEGKKTDKNARMERQQEHFTEVLNREAPDNQINESQEIATKDIEVDTGGIRESKVREAMKKKENEKAPGMDRVTRLTMKQL